MLEERESESEVSEEVMKVSYVWGFIVVSNFGIIAQIKCKLNSNVT